MKYMVAILLLAVAGCVGSPVHSTITYNNNQAAIKHNNHDLLDLVIGMYAKDVRTIMGDPERSEGYPWGNVWLYRTAMTSGIYGTADTDFTPVVFDNHGLLVGWGRNFFEERAKQYEVKIN